MLKLWEHVDDSLFQSGNCLVMFDEGRAVSDVKA